MPRTRIKGEGSLLKLNGCDVWYAQFYRNGRQIRESTKVRGAKTGANRKEALRVLRSKMGRSELGFVPDSELDKIRYADLREALIANYTEKGNKSLYQTAEGGETICGLKALDSFFGFSEKNRGPGVREITTDTGRRFAKKQLAEGFSTATVNRSLACLRRMLRVAKEEGKIQNVPVVRLHKEPPARKGFLTHEKFEELLGVLPTHLRPLVQFLYYCGCRLGETRSIEWHQVDLRNRLIRLEEDQTKNDEARIIPIPSVVAERLEAMQPKTGQVFDDTNLRTEWAKACEAVGLGKREKRESEDGNPWHSYSGLIVHDLRRTAIRNLVNAGNPEKLVMKISGHKTRSVFDRYHIVNADDISAAMQRREAATLDNGETINAQPTPKKPAKSVPKLKAGKARA